MMTELMFLDNPDKPYMKGAGEFKESNWMTVTGLNNVYKKIEKIEDKGE